ncbi:MAG TPA: hypothetical protein VM327_04220 [Candidatus Thermoplasmatota archaeon]|nr:hypothetical protein [Candidatus Thermoplasmatota archaeon]
MLLALAVPSAQAAGGLPGSFERVAAAGSFLHGASALHGEELVWASQTHDGGFDILRTDLQTQETAVLTSVVSASGGLRVQGMAFDGRWVTWLDDRFGNVEAFALDTSSSSLRRLTSTLEDEAGLTSSNGRAAWVHKGSVQVVDLESDLRWSPANGRTDEPCLTGPFLVWSSPETNGNPALHALDIELNVTRVMAMSGETTGHRNARCDGDLVAWERIHYDDAGTGPPTVVRMILWGDLRDGSWQNVTAVDPRRGRLLGFTAGHLAWLDVSPHGMAVYAHDVAANRTVDLGDLEMAGLSQEALVVAREAPAGQWTLYAQRWDAEEAAPSQGIPGSLAGATAACLLVAAGLRPRPRM